MPAEHDGYDQAESDLDSSFKLHSLRLMFLERLVIYVNDVQTMGGLRAIPFMQVLLMLTSDLDSEEEKDRASLDSLLSTLIAQLNIQQVLTVCISLSLNFICTTEVKFSSIDINGMVARVELYLLCTCIS